VNGKSIRDKDFYDSPYEMAKAGLIWGQLIDDYFLIEILIPGYRLLYPNDPVKLEEAIRDYANRAFPLPNMGNS
jgi:hypothetical protein